MDGDVAVALVPAVAGAAAHVDVLADGETAVVPLRSGTDSLGLGLLHPQWINRRASMWSFEPTIVQAFGELRLYDSDSSTSRLCWSEMGDTRKRAQQVHHMG